MKAQTLNSMTLAFFAAVYLGLWTGACGGGQRIREKQDAEIKQAADQADLARPLDRDRITGSAATVTGCLEKQDGAYVLTRSDLPVSVATSGPDKTGGPTPNAAAASSPSYCLNAKKDTLDRYVGRQVTVNGTLSKLESGKGTSVKDFPEIDVSSATLVSEGCR